jgi:hypothetical protein
MAMIVGRILYQGSKLSLVNLHKDTVLWELCGHAQGERPDVDNSCYLPMDRLLARKPAIEKQLAARHLQDGCLVLYDITSTWFEGEYQASELVAFGRPARNKPGCEAIAIGLLTNKDGCPVAVEVFRGNTADQSTVWAQAKRLAESFGIKTVIFAGDRGMLTPKRVAEVTALGFHTLTALTHPQIMTLLERKVLQTGLFDERQLIELHDPDKPTERYVLCKNAETQQEETATRNALVAKTIQGLTRLANSRKKRKNQELSANVGEVLSRYRVAKFFTWQVTRGKLDFALNQQLVAQEEALDGCYIIRTEAPAAILTKDQAVQDYKQLAAVERGFRNLKTVALEIRPVYHHLDDRIRAHVFICMLAYYVQWHTLQLLKPLFAKDGKGGNRRWSFEAVLARLKSLRQEVCLIGGVPLRMVRTRPDEEQRHIIELLGVDWKGQVASRLKP